MRYMILAVVLMFSLFGSVDKARSAAPEGAAEAIFAGGCFWCMESAFQDKKSVYEVLSGYAGGSVDNPSYKQVSKGGTGHREVILVRYNPKKISYETLLDIFWHNIDPFDAAGQFCDKGFQYSAAIYAGNADEKALAEKTKRKFERKLGQDFVTDIEAAAVFYPAEEYHQDYYLKNPWKYKFYRGGCGRDKRLKEVWGRDAGGH